ncbi:hypothetical protein [Fuerstiella marisgermanici]|uniref:Uncharacterized protein n=1 Tax=Fuerstiella marisgermanici TaxID=1891926 RepID=A0A1P8WAQ1_9PLAN|nr:hypothetical protein [Fuerstiella marisgermanici]APZ91126.1 hypothetical protein Fuma_00712 [Fuerstiella marisgermanici]
MRPSFLICLAFIIGTGPAFGQKDDPRQRRFPVQLEVLVQPQLTYRQHTQKWGGVFYELQQRATFRSGRTGEKTEVKETDRGGQPAVTAIGIMNRNGSITFGDKTFTINDPQPLKEWLQSLEEFGAGGPPNESSTWGLNDKQFAEVLTMLGQRVTEPVALTSLDDAVASLQLPAAFTVTPTPAAQARAARMRTDDQPTNDFKGLTKGSVLAITLAQFGLGFRPKAGPGGGYVIEIDVGNESDNMYPVGWQNTEPIVLVVPELAKTTEVELEGANVDALIALLARTLKLPHFYSTYEIAASGTDVSTLTYSRKPGKLTPFRLMKIIGTTFKLGLSLRTDEAGSVFLWVTTEDEYQAFRKRFAHATPKP